MSINAADVQWDTPSEIVWDGPAKKPNWRDTLSRQLGLAARLPIEAATTGAGAVADALTALNNMGRQVTGGAPSPMPSKSLDARLDKAFGEPQGPWENLANIGGGIAIGAVVDPVNAIQKAAAKLAPKGFESGVDEARKVARELREAGLKLPPQKGEGAVANALEGLGGRAHVAQDMSASNQPLIEGLARRANKLPATAPLTHDVLVNQAKALANEGYKPVENVGRLPLDGRFRRELVDIARELGTNKSFPQYAKDEVTALVRKFYYADADNTIPTASMSGKDAISSIRSLREEATDLFTSDSGNKALARAKERIAKVLEEQTERSLNARGKDGAAMLESYRSTRAQLAKNYATRRMLSDRTTGTIDTAKAASQHYSGEPLTGELRLIAQAGSPRFRSSMQVPKGGVPEFNVYDNAMMFGGGGLGFGGSPELGGALFAFPFARAGSRKVLESKAGQRYMGSTGLFGDDVAARLKLQAAGQLPGLFAE